MAEGQYNIVYHDDRELARYDLKDHAPSFPLTLSANGQVVAYTLTESTKIQRVVVQDKKGPEFKIVAELTLSADGKREAYWAESSDDEIFVVAGGKRFPLDEWPPCGPVFSGDGNTVAYPILEDDWWSIRLGKRDVPFPSKKVQRIFLSRDGGVVGFIERIPEGEKKVRMRVRVDGQSGELFDQIGQPIVSSDGKHVAYRANTSSEWVLVVDNRKIEAPGIVSDPVFSPDETRIGYGARSGQELWWKVISLK